MKRILLMLMLLAMTAGRAETLFKEYAPLSGCIVNPLTGNVCWAEDVSAHPQPFTLVYANITWRDLEPEEGAYAFEIVEEACHFSWWKEQSKHIILRLTLDLPGKKKHSDLPQWLMERTAGAYYECPYGAGYCPDYSDPVLIAHHSELVKRLGERYDNDPFVSFIEIGSLGHWGEWHIHERAGKMPPQDVRTSYVRAYAEAFPHTHLLMRRPFQEVSAYGLGLFNDASGSLEETLIWLDWIGNGGSYEDEEKGLVPAPDAWKTAPVGGELTTAVPPPQLLQDSADLCMRLFRLSHTSWIGPNSFSEVQDRELQGKLDRILENTGYRLRVAAASVTGSRLSLTFTNDGIAPFYYDWPVMVRVRTGEEQHVIPVPAALSGVLPGTMVHASVDLDGLAWESIDIGILDPMNGLPSIRLAMDVPEEKGWHVLFP